MCHLYGPAVLMEPVIEEEEPQEDDDDGDDDGDDEMDEVDRAALLGPMRRQVSKAGVCSA